MTPYYADDLVTIHHGRAADVLIDSSSAIVADPPYGMNWANAVVSGINGARGPGHKARSFQERVVSDDEPFDPSPWLDFPEVILFGANHYGWLLPRGTTLVWLKRNDDAFGSFLSDAEIAWQKGGMGVYCYRDTGYKTSEQRFHPTQKPIGVMRWVVGRTTSPLIVDPYMGSGSTLVAAKSLGRKAIGIEIEERYCEIAAKRCSQEVLGLETA